MIHGRLIAAKAWRRAHFECRGFRVVYGFKDSGIQGLVL